MQNLQVERFEVLKAY